MEGRVTGCNCDLDYMISSSSGLGGHMKAKVRVVGQIMGDLVLEMKGIIAVVSLLLSSSRH